jgi:serine/threonine protein phosphatase PrpC
MSADQDTTAPLETAPLQEAWAARAAATPRCHAWISLGARTDLGQVRENNEDKFDFIEPDEPSVLAAKGRVYAVADGMGGHSAGQIAAELALSIFIRAYYSDLNPEVETCAAQAVRSANAHIVETARTVPGRSGMGATLTAAIIRDDDLFLAQVGDSRCYLLRNGRLEQVTEDHSWVAEQVRSGAMSLSDAEQSPFRNVITRSMGGAPEVEPDLLAVKLLPGDRFLLCSDGLSGMVPEDELADLLGRGSPSVAAWNLVDRANQYGGRDNITALVLAVTDVQPWPEEVAGADAAERNGGQAAAGALAGTPEAAGGNGCEEFLARYHESTSPGRAGGSAQLPDPPLPARERGGLWGRLFRRA